MILWEKEIIKIPEIIFEWSDTISTTVYNSENISNKYTINFVNSAMVLNDRFSAIINEV